MIEFDLPLKPFIKSLQRRFHGDVKPPRKKIQLDPMGSLVWQMIDGASSTQDIIKQFANHYSITLQEAETSVTTFLVELGRRGLIAMK